MCRDIVCAMSRHFLCTSYVVDEVVLAVLIALAGVGALTSRRRKDEDSVTVDRS